MKIRRSSAVDQATAYHEAGHVVVAFRLGVRILKKGVSIEAADDHEGVIHLSRAIGGNPLTASTDKMIANAQRQVMVALAGLESQRNYRASSVRKYHAHTDYANAINLLSRFSGSAEELTLWTRLLMCRTKAIVESPTWWPVIEDLAKVLLDKRRLTGKETVAAVRKILSAHAKAHGRKSG